MVHASTQICKERKKELSRGCMNRPNIVSFIKSKRMEWFDHFCRTDGQVMKEVLINKVNKKRPLRKPMTSLGECYSSRHRKYKKGFEFR